MANLRQKKLGILGGMGPLASAEFLKTIYEYNLQGQREQETPMVLLYSDPSFPDRTAILLQGDEEILRNKLITALEHLFKLDVDRIIICCITAHFVIPQLPKNFKPVIINLITIILEAVLKNPQNYLLICSEGTAKMGIFQSHSLWNLVKDYISFPNEKEQKKIHQIIYQLKQQGNISQSLKTMETFKSDYQVNQLIAGCTEMHLLNKAWILDHKNAENSLFLDPLMLIATTLDQYL